MLEIILVLLIVLWLFGYVTIPWIHIPNPTLFAIGQHAITLWQLLIFLVILWAIEQLGGPVRNIAIVLLILWLLSVLGIIAISGLSNLLVLALIIGIIISLLRR